MLGGRLDISSRFRPENLENPGHNGADSGHRARPADREILVGSAVSPNFKGLDAV
jgi:hypothetical protein